MNAKRVYLRGWAYTRQFFARIHDPFIWKDLSALKKRFEEPLVILKETALGGQQ